MATLFLPQPLHTSPPFISRHSLSIKQIGPLRDLQSFALPISTTDNLTLFIESFQALQPRSDARFNKVMNVTSDGNNVLHRLFKDLGGSDVGRTQIANAIPILIGGLHFETSPGISPRIKALQSSNPSGKSLLELIVGLNHPAVTFAVYTLVGMDNFHQLAKAGGEDLTIKMGEQLYEHAKTLAKTPADFARIGDLIIDEKPEHPLERLIQITDMGFIRIPGLIPPTATSQTRRPRPETHQIHLVK